MLIAHYESARDNEPAVVDMSWPELAEMLSAHDAPACSAPGAASSLPPCAGRECPVKRGPAWSPVEIGGPRANANVRAVTAAVFDVDHVAPLAFDELLDRLAGLDAVAHSTHSHDPRDGCYRVVLRLSRPATREEWPRLRAAVVAAYAVPADPATSDLSRIYFLPSVRDGVAPSSAILSGSAVDVDALLTEVSRAPAQAAEPASVDLIALRRALADARRAKAHGGERERAQADVLGRVLDGLPLAEAGARDATLLRALGLIAYHTPAGTPWSAAHDLVRPSLAAMDCEPEGLESWLALAEQKYARVAKARAAADAARAVEDAALKELVRSVSAVPVTSAAAVAGEDWEKLLINDSDGGLMQCERNAQLLLSSCPELRGTFRFNDVHKRVEVRGGPLAGTPLESLGSVAAAWLQTHRSFYAGQALVGREISIVARQASYDPIKEYLQELAWDRRERVSTFLEDHFSAEPSPYVRAVSRRWLVALVARALRPGCEVQNVLILEGPQGVGKTRALRALGGEHYLGTSVHLADKDFLQTISSAWLVELGELASLKRAESEKIKQFVDQRADRFRLPYAHVPEEWPRRCVFVGTTNESDYLRDRTGNRRYWPVRVGAVDVDGVARDRDQLLAEAVEALASGERWWLDGDEVAMAESETDERLEASAVEDAVARWWYGSAPSARPPAFTALDLAEQALHVSVDRLDRALQTQIGAAAKRLGFARARVSDGGRRSYRYEATEEMLSAPQKARGAAGALGVVAGAKVQPQARGA